MKNKVKARVMDNGKSAGHWCGWPPKCRTQPGPEKPGSGGYQDQGDLFGQQDCRNSKAERRAGGTGHHSRYHPLPGRPEKSDKKKSIEKDEIKARLDGRDVLLIDVRAFYRSDHPGGYGGYF